MCWAFDATPDDYQRIVWNNSLEGIRFKVRMRAEQFLINSETLYESIILALSMAFGGKSKGQESVTRATTAGELQRELEGFLHL